MNPPRLRAVLLTVLIIAGAAVGACSSDDDGATTSSSPPTAPTTSGPSTTSAPEGTLVAQVFFLDEDAFNIGRPPYVAPVDRTVTADAPARSALDALFAGPTAAERAAGLRFVASGATGVTDVRVEDGTAHVTLAGGCSSGGSTFTVADQIAATLRQFPTVDAVKIYDPAGRTASPDQPGDSIPACLEP